MTPFVHLHVHSQYSILDGLATIPKLVDKALADRMPGMAITDHGNMMGIKDFVDYVAKINKKRKEDNLHLFKPIIGCEMYVKDDSIGNHSVFSKGSHLTVLAKNIKGYRNLSTLVSLSWTEGYQFRPQVTKQQIVEHSEGLIVCSGCLRGEVPGLILAGETKKAEQAILWFKEVFGDDSYIEIQRHKTSSGVSGHDVYSAQQQVEKVLLDLGRKHNIKVIATNDVHFLNEEDAEAFDHLVCIGSGQSVNDPQHTTYTKQEWFKSNAEMNELFADLPQCLENTVEILNKVEFYSINHKPEFPVILTESDKNAIDNLRTLTYEGASKRWGESLTSEQKSRLEYELDLINQAGFSEYFLILHDLVCAAHERGVLTGPGRGSAAGSALCYCLGITQVDPLKFNLLFERFLNPEHPLFPDIDLDLDNEGRVKVISYLTEKYGRNKIAGIVSFEKMPVGDAIINVAKAEGISSSESVQLAKKVISRLRQGNEWHNRISLNDTEKYQEIIKKSDVRVQKTLKFARLLENAICGIGLHACGVAIGKDTLSNYAPICLVYDKFTERRVNATQYNGTKIEDTGLIKLDLLGLNALSVIKDTLEIIKNKCGIDVDINRIPLDDQRTYQLYSEGRTTGTFLFDYEGMQQYLKLLRPQKFDELIALNVLYRPDTLNLLPEYIERKHDCESIDYDIPEMEKYLKDTYGVLIYQEQLMLLSQQLANFTPGESDTLRKVMAKKHLAKMTELRSKFLEEGQSNGYDPVVLAKIWSEWESFASYAFNKSHATCYTLIAYQTAWLKANYPEEFMAVVLNHAQNDKGKLTKLLKE